MTAPMGGAINEAWWIILKRSHPRFIGDPGLDKAFYLKMDLRLRKDDCGKSIVYLPDVRLVQHKAITTGCPALSMVA